MTCRELGGPCDKKLIAGSWDQMRARMTDHVTENHPETAQKMKEMNEKDPDKWSQEMEMKWDATPEDEED